MLGATYYQYWKKEALPKYGLHAGDGTLPEEAYTIKERDFLIRLLPNSSANGLALNVGLSYELDPQLLIGMSNNYILIDLLEIKQHTCPHIAHIGVNAALIENYENSDILGKLGYLSQALPTLHNSKYLLEANG